MKRTVIKILALITAMGSVRSAYAEYIPNKNISVFCDSRQIKADAQIINDRLILPMRSIFEAMKAEVIWDGESKTVTAQRADTTIKMTVGEKNVLINSSVTVNDTAPVIIDDKMYVPVRVICEALNCDVKWYDYSRVAEITSKEFEADKTIAEIPQSEIDGIRYVDVDPTVNYTGTNVPDSFFDAGSWTVAENTLGGVTVADDGKNPSFYNEKLSGLVSFKMTMHNTNSWPSIAFAQTDNTSRYTEADCYLISFCEDVIQLQKFIKGGRNVIYAQDSLYPKSGGAIFNKGGSVVSDDKTYSVTVGTINEEDGVRIILIIDDKTIIDYLDKEASALTEDGYLGIYSGPDGSFTLEPCEDGEE